MQESLPAPSCQVHDENENGEKVAISEKSVGKIKLSHKRLGQEVGFYLPQYKKLEICGSQHRSLWRVRGVAIISIFTQGRWQLWALRECGCSAGTSGQRSHVPHWALHTSRGAIHTSDPLQQNAKSWMLLRTVCRGVSRTEPPPSSGEGDEQRLLGYSREKKQNYQHLQLSELIPRLWLFNCSLHISSNGAKESSVGCY